MLGFGAALLSGPSAERGIVAKYWFDKSLSGCHLKHSAWSFSPVPKPRMAEAQAGGQQTFSIPGMSAPGKEVRARQLFHTGGQYLGIDNPGAPAVASLKPGLVLPLP